MNTRFVRRTSKRMTTIVTSLAVAASMLGLAGLAALTLPSAHEQRDPSPIAYDEDEDPMSEAVAALLDTASSLHGSIDTLTYEQRYEGQTYSKQAFIYVPASYSPGTPANVLYLTHDGGATRRAWPTGSLRSSTSWRPRARRHPRSSCLRPTTRTGRSRPTTTRTITPSIVSSRRAR